MATAAPGYMTGSRRTYNPIVGGGGGNFAGGTAALNDSEVLARLIANLRNFYSAQPGMGNQQPSIVDVLNQSVGADLSQQGPGGEMSAPAPGVDTLDPQTLSLLGSIIGAGGMLAQNSGAAALGNIMSTGGALAQQGPLDALQTFGSIGAGMAGANPGVIGAVNTGINILQDPVPMTSGDIAGKALNVALGFTPIGTVNSIMSALTGKSLGDVVKGAMTPVENAMPNMVPGVNPSAAVQMGTPAQPDTPPGIALTDLALSMLNAPAPMADATPTNPEAPMGIPGESGFGTPAPAPAPSVDTSIAEAIAANMSAMAESSMNAPAAPDTSSAPSAPSAPGPSIDAQMADLSAALDMAGEGIGSGSTASSIADAMDAAGGSADLGGGDGGGGGGDGGCFITTATVQHIGEADDGPTLTSLRRFRDSYMASSPELREQVAVYYKRAPEIVKKLNARPDAEIVYQTLWANFIKPAAHAAQQGDNAATYNLYVAGMRWAEAQAQ